MRCAAIFLAFTIAPVTLPGGWLLEPPPGVYVWTGTMPQGMALSPDGSTIAVVESGYNPPALSLYRVSNLARVARISLPGAFGRPVWKDSRVVLVAGANADALLSVDVRSGNIRREAFPAGSYPLLVARSGGKLAVASAGDDAVRTGKLDNIGQTAPIRIGGFPAGLAFDDPGRLLFVTVRSENTLLAIDTTSLRVTGKVKTRLHPSAVLASGGKVYVAESDADSVAVYRTRDLRFLERISVADKTPFGSIGVSPNALSEANGTIFATLGAANSVAVIRNGRLARRLQAGWYPTDAQALRNRLYVLDGKGEGARPNPDFRPGSDREYIGAIERGSLRAYTIQAEAAMNGSPQGQPSWLDPDPASVVRAKGPIRHVFFILKENRSYDQVLGDVPQGNGEASLTWFGRMVTPNEHAIAGRFGLFDNAYASGEVSAPGHLWAEAAFVNDNAERFWPLIYGNRSREDDIALGDGTRPTESGYIWQAALRAHVSFRDYGELADAPKTPGGKWIADVPSLRGRFDPSYAGWNLDDSDLDRVREWRREFDAFVGRHTVPQFEFIWLPNDHTYGSKPGKFTPSAFVAQNDYAFGQIVDIISHSRVWSSSAIFAIEDDAQDGPDHVSDQRTTLFVASPYAGPGVRHNHFTTMNVLRTIEVLLGIHPLSTYDAMAAPMYAAFAAAPDLRPYNVLAPRIDIFRRNARAAYGAHQSAYLDFSRPDAIPPATMNRILARNSMPQSK